MIHSQFKKLFTYNDIVTLKQIEMMLQNHNIQFMVRSYEDTAYNGLYTLTKGKGDILVFENDYEKALSLLQEEKII